MQNKEEGGCPFHKTSGEPLPYGSSDLNYGSYLKIPELLSLQAPQSDPAHHDELLFIIIHQSYELWFKLVLHEMGETFGYLQKPEILKAHHFMKRAVAIIKMLVPQIHMLETMKPVDFLRFRDKLMPASGFQSLQFREIEFFAGLKDQKYLEYFKNDKPAFETLNRRFKGSDLSQAYFDALRKLGFKIPKGSAQENKEAYLKAILPIFQNPDENLEVYLFSESLIEFDEYLGLWRDHHVRVIERIIGFKQGTGGSSGVEYLKTTTSKKCFPLLWEVRTHLR